jgi:hypothetical protein
MYFGLKNKVDRIDMQQSLYEQQMLFERKTKALEKMVLKDTDYQGYLELKAEINSLQTRIDKHLEDHYRKRNASNAIVN